MKNKKIKYLPEYVRIAGHTITIETFGIDTAKAGNLFAAYHSIDAKIVICADLDDKIAVLDSLIHEIGHAIWFLYGIRDEDNEEHTVNQMAIGWSQIWADNPDMVKFLNYAVK